MMNAFEKMSALVERLRANGTAIRTLDLGGGLGGRYKPAERTPAVDEFVAGMMSKVVDHDLEVMIEPGRSIGGEAGMLLTRGLYRKPNGAEEFVTVVAG